MGEKMSRECPECQEEYNYYNEEGFIEDIPTDEELSKILICGTRKLGYDSLVRARLNDLKSNLKEFEIIEGCCDNSADAYAERWAIDNGIRIYHFPSTSGNYLKRNIEMVQFADKVIAFWDGFSYGTCHTIATAVMLGKPVEIINIK